MSNIKKNKTVKVKTKNDKEYSYAYTDLASINEYLETNKIKYYQYIESTEYGDYIMTVIVENEVEKPPRRGCKVIEASTTSGGNAVQDYGAILTYSRRYSLLLALGLATEDNDGNELTQGTFEINDKKKITTKEEAEKLILTFGKHQGKTLKEVVQTDKNYTQWLLEKGRENIKQAVSLLINPTSSEEEKIHEGQKQILEFAIEDGIITLNEVLTHMRVQDINDLTNTQANEEIKVIQNRRIKKSKEKEEVF